MSPAATPYRSWRSAAARKVRARCKLDGRTFGGSALHPKSLNLPRSGGRYWTVASGPGAKSWLIGYVSLLPASLSPARRRHRMMTLTRGFRNPARDGSHSCGNCLRRIQLVSRWDTIVSRTNYEGGLTSPLCGNCEMRSKPRRSAFPGAAQHLGNHRRRPARAPGHRSIHATPGAAGNLYRSPDRAGVPPVGTRG
jgi:hypothetical protein